VRHEQPHCFSLLYRRISIPSPTPITTHASGTRIDVNGSVMFDSFLYADLT